MAKFDKWVIVGDLDYPVETTVCAETKAVAFKVQDVFYEIWGLKESRVYPPGAEVPADVAKVVG